MAPWRLEDRRGYSSPPRFPKSRPDTVSPAGRTFFSIARSAGQSLTPRKGCGMECRGRSDVTGSAEPFDPAFLDIPAVNRVLAKSSELIKPWEKRRESGLITAPCRHSPAYFKEPIVDLMSSCGLRGAPRTLPAPPSDGPTAPRQPSGAASTLPGPAIGEAPVKYRLTGASVHYVCLNLRIPCKRGNVGSDGDVM